MSQVLVTNTIDGYTRTTAHPDEKGVAVRVVRTGKVVIPNNRIQSEFMVMFRLGTGNSVCLSGFTEDSLKHFCADVSDQTRTALEQANTPWVDPREENTPAPDVVRLRGAGSDERAG